MKSSMNLLRVMARVSAGCRLRERSVCGAGRPAAASSVRLGAGGNSKILKPTTKMTLPALLKWVGISSCALASGAARCYLGAARSHHATPSQSYVLTVWVKVFWSGRCCHLLSHACALFGRWGKAFTIHNTFLQPQLAKSLRPGQAAPHTKEPKWAKRATDRRVSASISRLRCGSPEHSSLDQCVCYQRSSPPVRLSMGN